MKEQELSLKDCIGVIKKRKKIILLVFLIAVIGSAVLSFVLPPVYEVKSTIKIGQIMDLSTFEKIPIESAVASAQFFQGSQVLGDAIRDLKLPFTLKKLRKRISAEPVGQEKDLVEIRVEMIQARQALNVADYLVDRLRERHQQIKQLHENKSQILARYDEHIASIARELSEIKQRESAILATYNEQVKGINRQLSAIETNRKEIIAEYDETIKGISEQLPEIKNDIAEAKEEMKKMMEEAQPLSEAESRLLVGYMEDIEAKQERYDILLGQSREAQTKKTELLASNQAQRNSLMEALREAQTRKTELFRSEQQQYDALMKEKREAEVEKTKLQRLESEKMYPTEVVVPPGEPEEPIRPNKLLNIVVAAVISLVVGLGLAFSLESLERTK
ncbi:hypothetical protein ES703_14554 [subsurface metagenome]